MVVCILYAVGTYNDPAFFDRGAVLFALLWCMSLPLVFNGTACERYAEDQSAPGVQRWYLVSFVAAFFIPLITSVIAVVYTGIVAYLLVFLVAAIFTLRNHRLYLQLNSKD